MSIFTTLSRSQITSSVGDIPESPPQVSIIIVNYNGGTLLQRCINSVLHTDSQNYEIILVDNASTDGSPHEVAHNFSEVQLIRNECNVGFGEANNIGLHRARGTYLAFLNPDTLVETGWLDALVAILETDPAHGLATPKILLLDTPDTINTCGNDVHYTGLTLCRGAGMQRDTLDEVAEVSAISGAAFVIRRDLFAALGGFDATFFLYMEDTDLSWRARLAGYRCIYVPTAVVYHDYTLHFGSNKTFYQERNRYLMLLKGLRWATLLTLAPALLLAELVTWGFVLLRERRYLSNKLRAYAWIIHHWNEIMQSRRQTQQLRRVRDRDLLAGCSYRLAYAQTGDGLLAHMAQRVFDPLFSILQRVALALIWW